LFHLLLRLIVVCTFDQEITGAPLLLIIDDRSRSNFAHLDLCAHLLQARSKRFNLLLLARGSRLEVLLMLRHERFQ
jgi:hypothetical protein